MLRLWVVKIEDLVFEGRERPVVVLDDVLGVEAARREVRVVVKA